MQDTMPSIKILGTAVTTASKDDILEYIFKRLQKTRKKFYIVTPNPEIISYAARSKPFQRILNEASVSLPDGIGVLVAGMILNKHITGRITGVDFMEELCRESVEQAATVGFLGGRDGVAEATAECLVKKYPGLKVKFIGEEWPFDSRVLSSFISRSTSSSTAGAHRDSLPARHPSPHHINNDQPSPINHIDILFVAMGFPKQEEWIAKNLPNIDVTVAMGVGGAFDYISGKVPRAKTLVRSLGLEWAYRLVRQPWRAKRQLALPVFAYQVFKERLS